MTPHQLRIHELGHIVLYVSNLDRSVSFYHDLLGFPMIAREGNLALFSSGRTHHEMLLIEIGIEAESKKSLRPGLYHIGFKIGNTDDELRNAIETLEKSDARIIGTGDHTVTHSVYVLDPDGNEIELYVDISDAWKHDPKSILAPVRPLHL